VDADRAKKRVLCLRPAIDFTDVGVVVPADLDVSYVADERDVKKIPADVEGLVLPSVGRALAPSMFDEAVALRLVQFTGAGVDRVPAELVAKSGAAVCNVPGASASDVAAYVVVAAGLLLRGTLLGHDLVLAGRYDEARRELVPKNARGFRDVHVGVIGLGNIGSAVAHAFHGLGAIPRWYDPAPVSDDVNVYERADFSELLRWSDVLTIHVPLVATTKGLIGKDELALLPRGSVVVNAARGGIVDEAALVDALDIGHVSGVALDVFEEEPLPADSPLIAAARRHAGRVFLTPHIGGVTRQAAAILFERAWANVRSVLVEGREPAYRVI
jgi:phosphoglycerate dehydrogenase-like enzyme